MSSPLMTVQVNVDQAGVIRWTARVTQKFVGQPMKNLVQWLRADVVEEIGAE